MKCDHKHALSCDKGRFVSLRHNHICSITGSLLTKTFELSHFYSSELENTSNTTQQEGTRLDLILIYVLEVSGK